MLIEDDDQNVMHQSVQRILMEVLLRLSFYRWEKLHLLEKYNTLLNQSWQNTQIIGYLIIEPSELSKTVRRISSI